MDHVTQAAFLGGYQSGLLRTVSLQRGIHRSSMRACQHPQAVPHYSYTPLGHDASPCAAGEGFQFGVLTSVAPSPPRALGHARPCRSGGSAEAGAGGLLQASSTQQAICRRVPGRAESTRAAARTPKPHTSSQKGRRLSLFKRSLEGTGARTASLSPGMQRGKENSRLFALIYAQRVCVTQLRQKIQKIYPVTREARTGRASQVAQVPHGAQKQSMLTATCPGSLWCEAGQPRSRLRARAPEPIAKP